MKILLVGNGGREHAIAWKLAQSGRISKMYSTRGNAGIAKFAEVVDIAPTDVDGVAAFARDNAIDLVVVAPDDPLVLGMVDAVNAVGVRAFGPNKLAAELEGSKVFAKNLMKKYNIPTAAYEVFDDADAAIEYLRASSYPTVIKAEGLALGKGVIIATDFEMAKTAVIDIMQDKCFGDAGKRVVIEEFLEGREITVLAFTDGETICPMPSSQDHKRALDGDEGLNTGGMGAFSPSPIFTDEVADWCMANVFRPTVEAMNTEGRRFKGVLYFGLIMTQSGIKVIEFNARFGDPETQVILPQLKTDLLDIFDAVIDEKLGEIKIEWELGAVCGVVMASGGYPQKYEVGKVISGIDAAEKRGVQVFIAGAKHDESGELVTSGGRVLCAVALGDDLADAREKAYSGVGEIEFEGAHYRRDIAVVKRD